MSVIHKAVFKIKKEMESKKSKILNGDSDNGVLAIELCVMAECLSIISDVYVEESLSSRVKTSDGTTKKRVVTLPRIEHMLPSRAVNVLGLVGIRNSEEVMNSTATFDDLVKYPNCGESTARKIIEYRNYLLEL